MANVQSLNKFIPPSKYTAVADAVDMIVWESLPIPTHFYSTVINDMEDYIPNEWDIEEGFFEATFGAWGTYTFVLSSPGFEDLTCVFEVSRPPINP